MPETMILDTKHDYEWVKESPRVISFDDLDFSPIAPPRYATPAEFINRWMHLYREIFWGAELQHAAVAPSLERLVRSSRVHALSDLYEELQKDKSPAGKGAVQRLDSIRLAYPTIFASTKNLWEALHEMSIYCSVVGPQSQAVRFLFWMLATERFEYRKKTAQRDQLHTVIVVDEAPATFSRRQQTVSGMPSPPVQLLPVTREYGIQFWVSSPSMTELDELLLPQFSVQIMMTPNDGRQVEALRKTFRLTPAQEAFGVRMPLGTAIGKRRGIEHPFVFTYPEFTKPKTPSPAIVAAARERTRAFCEAHALPTAAVREGVPGWVTPALVPSSSPLPTSAAAVGKKKPRIALNDSEERLLRFVAERRVALTTEIDLHPEQVRRAKSKLRTLGFLREERIISRSGRGSSAVALALTPAGYERIGVRSGGAGRGKLQHQYLALSIHRLLPGSQLEYSIGEKRIDVFLTYDPTNPKHEQLLTLVPSVALNPGDGIAIEIESSDPKKTAASNIAQNNDAGITLTITATLPKHLLYLSTIAPNVVDVFALLAALTENP